MPDTYWKLVYYMSDDYSEYLLKGNLESAILKARTLAGTNWPYFEPEDTLEDILEIAQQNDTLWLKQVSLPKIL